jgi:replicative DNA helicase
MTAAANGVIATRRPATVRPVRSPFDTSSLDRPAAERTALAGMLLAIGTEPERVAAIAAGLPSAMFTQPHHAEIMAALAWAASQDKPSVAAVAAAVRSRAADDGDDGGPAVAAVASLLEEWVGPEPCLAAELAAVEVRKAHGSRMALHALADGAERVREGQATATDLAAIAEQLGQASSMVEPANSGAAGLTQVLDQWARAEQEPVVRTMFGPLDRRLGGGLAIGLTGIAAKPGVGKSALGCQLVLGSLLADRQARAIWFRGEMTNSLLAGKMVAIWSALRDDAVPPATFKDCLRRTKSARAVAVDMAGTLGDRLVVVDPPLTPERMEQEIARVRPQLAVVDYLQLCEAAGRQDRRGEIEHVTRTLARAATKYGTAIVVVSAIAGTKNEGTGIGALAKESNLLEYDAHTFLTLWGDDKDKSADPREIRLKIEKSRTGVPGDVALHFSGSGQFFSPADAELADDPTFYAEFADYDPGALA